MQSVWKHIYTVFWDILNKFAYAIHILSRQAQESFAIFGNTLYCLAPHTLFIGCITGVYLILSVSFGPLWPIHLLVWMLRLLLLPYRCLMWSIGFGRPGPRAGMLHFARDALRRVEMDPFLGSLAASYQSRYYGAAVPAGSLFSRAQSYGTMDRRRRMPG